jgi:hypothetical protein
MTPDMLIAHKTMQGATPIVNFVWQIIIKTVFA